MELSLYRKTTSKMLEKAGVHFMTPLFYYTDSENGENVTIEFPRLNDEYVLNEIEPAWTPSDHNLVFRQDFKIISPQKLFGKEGVTSTQNEIGVAAHIYSKKSNFQETVHIESFTSDEKDPLEFFFIRPFEPNSLKGDVSIEFFFYLKKAIKNIEQTSSMEGFNLSEDYFLKYTIVLDGNGAEFPIAETYTPGKQLWKVEMDWTDIYYDSFDESSVRIILNSAHPLFESLIKTKPKMNRYALNSILTNSMIQVVQKVIFTDQENLDETIEYENGSIAQVVRYWISTFNINTDSLDSIVNSFNQATDEFIEEK